MTTEARPRSVFRGLSECSLIRTCCSTTRCGQQRERGTTTLVRRRLTSFALPAAWSPTSSAEIQHHLEFGRAISLARR